MKAICCHLHHATKSMVLPCEGRVFCASFVGFCEGRGNVEFLFLKDFLTARKKICFEGKSRMRHKLQTLTASIHRILGFVLCTSLLLIIPMTIWDFFVFPPASEGGLAVRSWLGLPSSWELVSGALFSLFALIGSWTPSIRFLWDNLKEIFAINTLLAWLYKFFKWMKRQREE